MLRVCWLVYLLDLAAGLKPLISAWQYSYVYPCKANGAIDPWAKISCDCKKDLVGLYTSSHECMRGQSHDKDETCGYADEDGKVSGLGADQCDFVVSKSLYLDNSQCMDLCIKAKVNHSKEDFIVLNENCKFEMWDTADGAIRLDSVSCFDQWEYGFLTGVVNEFKLAVYDNVPSAKDCQYLCQHNDDCARFQWKGINNPSGIPLPGVVDTTTVYTCALYGADHLNQAVHTIGGQNSAVCDSHIAGMCPTDDALPSFRYSYDSPCKMCQCQAICAWKNKSIIGGPKYCDSDYSKNGKECEFTPFPVLPTTSTTKRPRTTTAVVPKTSTTTATTAAMSTTSLCLSTTLEFSTTAVETTEPSYPTNQMTTEISASTTLPTSPLPPPPPPCPNCECVDCVPCECDCWDFDFCDCTTSKWCQSHRRRRLYEIAYGQ